MNENSNNVNFALIFKVNLVAELPVKVILGYLVDEWLVFRILRYQAKDITP